MSRPVALWSPITTFYDRRATDLDLQLHRISLTIWKRLHVAPDSTPPVFFQPLLSLHSSPEGVVHSSMALQSKSSRHLAAHLVFVFLFVKYPLDKVPFASAYDMSPSL